MDFRRSRSSRPRTGSGSGTGGSRPGPRTNGVNRRDPGVPGRHGSGHDREGAAQDGAGPAEEGGEEREADGVQDGQGDQGVHRVHGGRGPAAQGRARGQEPLQGEGRLHHQLTPRFPSSPTSGRPEPNPSAPKREKKKKFKNREQRENPHSPTPAAAGAPRLRFGFPRAKKAKLLHFQHPERAGDGGAPSWGCSEPPERGFVLYPKTPELRSLGIPAGMGWGGGRCHQHLLRVPLVPLEKPWETSAVPPGATPGRSCCSLLGFWG